MEVEVEVEMEVEVVKLTAKMVAGVEVVVTKMVAEEAIIPPKPNC